MFNFFIKPKSPFNYPIKKYYKFEFIKRKYNFEINKIKDYYRGKNRAVNNRHILNRLITILAPTYTLEDFDYYSIVDNNSKLVSKQFNITSNISKGRILNNELYGGNSDELFLYTENIIDLDTFKYVWMTAAPVRCIYSNSSDLSFNFPYNNITLPKNSFHIFEIDITMMLMMYKYWCLERVKEDNSTNPNVFIATIVLPNIIDSLIDIRLFNRYLCIALNKPVKKETVNNHPFPIVDYSKGIDEILKQIVKDTANSSIPLEQLLLSIPGIVEDSMLPIVKITNSYFTAQSRWVLYISKTNIILKLLKIFNKRGISRNREIVTELPFEIKTILRRSSNRLPDNLPVIHKDNFLKDAKAIQKIIGKR